MPQEFVVKLKLPQDVTYDQVEQAAPGTFRFVAFRYLIPLPIFPPVKRMSALYCVKSEAAVRSSAFKYNLFTLAFGWLGMPFGPSYTFAAIKHNKTGTDFTEEVLLNLTAKDFNESKVCIVKTNRVFIHPDIDTLKEIKKAFIAYQKKVQPLQEMPVVGEYIDTEKPYYMIAVGAKDFEKSEQIKTYLYTYFFPHIRFELMCKEEGTELLDKLLVQGLELQR